MTEIETRLFALEGRLNTLEGKVDQLLGAQNTMSQLLKYVVTPLIIILGALVGIKIVLP